MVERVERSKPIGSLEEARSELREFLKDRSDLKRLALVDGEAERLYVGLKWDHRSFERPDVIENGITEHGHLLEMGAKWKRRIIGESYKKLLDTVRNVIEGYIEYLPKEPGETEMSPTFVARAMLTFSREVDDILFPLPGARKPSSKL